MLPQRKKTAEEIASLRESMGVSSIHFPAQEKPIISEETIKTESITAPYFPPLSKKRPIHSFRKKDLVLAPAKLTRTKTFLPEKSNTAQKTQEMLRREAIYLNQDPKNFATLNQLKKEYASKILLSVAYLLALSPTILEYYGSSLNLKVAVFGVGILLTLWIFVRKPRSRHHAAFLFTIYFFTLFFGLIHYTSFFGHDS